jgi:cytochrome c551/c552
MQRSFLHSLLVVVSLLATIAAEASPQLAAARSCTACHDAEKQLVGPAFKAVAARYQGDNSAPDRLAAKVMAGGFGVWGAVPMPANAVSQEDARTLVTWILGGAPANVVGTNQTSAARLNVTATPDVVKRGRYLVENVMGCANCHAARTPDTKPIAGMELAGGWVYDTPMFVAQPGNLTPDPTGVGRFTAEELKGIIIRGKRPTGAPLAPMMPSNFYKALLPGDADAIVAYLSRVPPVRNETRGPQYKQGWTVDPLPDAEVGFDGRAVANDRLVRGRYMATLAHCLDCHTPGQQGATDFVKDGGRGGKRFGVARVLAPNITSHPEKGVGAWSEQELRRAMFDGIGRDGRTLQYPMPWPYLAGLTEDDKSSLLIWLRSLPPKD